MTIVVNHGGLTDPTKEAVMGAGTTTRDTETLATIRISITAAVGMQEAGKWTTSEVSRILETTKIITEIGEMIGREPTTVCKRQESVSMPNPEISEVEMTTDQLTIAVGEKNNPSIATTEEPTEKIAGLLKRTETICTDQTNASPKTRQTVEIVWPECLALRGER